MPKPTTPFNATRNLLRGLKATGIRVIRPTDPRRMAERGSYSPAFRSIEVARRPGGNPVSILWHESGHAANQTRERSIRNARFTARATGNTVAASVADVRMENGANKAAYRKEVTPYFKQYLGSAKAAVREAHGKVPAKLAPVLRRNFETEFLDRLRELDAKLSRLVQLSRK